MSASWGYVAAGYVLTAMVWGAYAWWSSRSADR